MAAPAAGADEAAQPPVTMANTKSEIVDAAVKAEFFDTAEAAETWTKQELIALWFGG